MYKYGSNGETDDMLEFDVTFDLAQDSALLDLDDDFLCVPVGKEATKLSTFEGLVARTMVPITYDSWLEVSEEVREGLWQYVLEKFVVDPKSRKQILQSIGKKWRNFKHYLYAKFIKNRSKDTKANLFKPPKDYPFIKKEVGKFLYPIELQRSGRGVGYSGTTWACTRDGRFITPQQYFYLPKNVKYYLEIENERVDKRINKLEDELEKLKRGVLNVSEAASCQIGGVIEDFEKQPHNESLDNSCLLAVEFAANVVAKGTIMKASDENIEVMIETILQGEALVPFPLEEEFIVKVKDALGHILSWPRHLVIRCSDLGKVVAKSVKKHATPVKKAATPLNEDATPVKEDATPPKEEIGSNKKEKGTGKMVDGEKQPCDMEGGNNVEEGNDVEEVLIGIEKKIKKEKQNVTVQRRWTRAQMKTRIRIENSSILKMTAMMADGQVTKVDSIRVQSENDLFGYDSYTYLTWDDFEAVLTMDELTGAVIVSYMMVLFKKLKYGSPEKDHGIFFVNPTVISPSTRKGKSKNIDDASRGLADRLSKRKGNDIIFMPYNPGRHWVLGVLDMKSDTCYYLDSLSSTNFNMQLKQIVDSAMVLYTTQSGSNKRVKLNWVNVTCPVQPGSTECGYYMLRFMKEIVEEGIEVLVKDNIGDGKVEYTTADIDEIREEWSTFVTGFIYR
ncbi:unnamed protein product [Lactuca saligna]|uniref:Ubiquitin-like protease family profile domain-containing protein n=1 Tax=Lactuca saligna TaxID=75948 RepID=A0AA35YMN8_LACSI|nr:unnamed protein product [Lactuca saligna]